MSKPLVSWLMPVYNSERFLRRALDSMLNQTYQNFEIIIVLESSCTDRSALICEEYATKDNRVKVHYKIGSLGVATSLNQGLKVCRGKYIARMDADDSSYPERLEKQVDFMEENTDVGILGAKTRIIKGQRTISSYEDGVPESDEIWVRLLFDNCIKHPTVMFRAEIFNNNELEYPMDYKAEDYALWASVISKVNISILPEVLLDYYVHGENICTVNFDKIRADSAKISRNALHRELGIDTSDYSDSLFGWRTPDQMPSDITKFLLESLGLLKKVQNANDTQKKFDPKIMEKALNYEWEKTLQIVAPYGEIDCLKVSIRELDKNKIEEIFCRIEDCISDDAKIKVIIYGTGGYSNGLINNLRDDEYPFEIIAFCDSDIQKHGKSFHGLPIISPGQIAGYGYDYISIATPLFEEEIRKSLLNDYSIESEKILDLPLSVIATRHRRKISLARYKHNNDERKAYLFCAPDYGNLGDHAIAAAEQYYFNIYLGIPLVEVPYHRFDEDISIVRANSRPEDIILITGGGFLGSLWEHSEFQVRRIVSLFPDNPVVIMPQTLHWDDSVEWDIEKARTRQIYETHKNLILCARDSETYRLMCEAYPECRIITAPDMVLAYSWVDYIKPSAQRKGALLCLKTDKESILSQKDWENLKGVAAEACGSSSICTTNLDEMISKRRRDEFLKQKLDEFSRAELVITDRLHGLLFSVITGTPCVAMNNCNHKIRATFKWVEHIPNLRFADNINKVGFLAKEVLSVGPREYRASEFRKHFDELEMTIKSLIN